MNDTVATPFLVPTKGDKEIANELRVKLEAALKPICALCDEAKAANLSVQFSVGLDYRGVTIITALKFIKEL